MTHAPGGLQQMSISTPAAANHLSSSVVVFIKVLDINDNVPTLAGDYQPFICEGTQAGEVYYIPLTVVYFGVLRIHMKCSVNVFIFTLRRLGVEQTKTQTSSAVKSDLMVFFLRNVSLCPSAHSAAQCCGPGRAG